jgi:dienelactone hydrolase
VLRFCFGLLCFLFLTDVSAALQRKNVAYAAGDTELQGVLIFETGAKRPGLLFVPNWLGINEANLKQAELVAKMGYSVFVADLYGKAVRPKNQQEAGAAAGAVKQDRAAMRARMRAAFEAMQAQAKAGVPIDLARVGAIGFCFGGTSVLEFARDGANVAGVVSFHGGLDAPSSYDASKVKSAVLVLHGADDPYVPKAEVDGFVAEMQKGRVDWEMISYGGAVHSFTDV